MAQLRARTPHGIALERFLLDNGPSTKSSLLDHVAKHVPVGLAMNTLYMHRTWNRQRRGHALEVAPDRVASNYVKQQVDPVASGARAVARTTLRNRLNVGTVFVNEDGLLQHRDWQRDGAS